MSSQLITLPCSKEIYDWVMESPDMKHRAAGDTAVRIVLEFEQRKDGER